MPVYKAVILIAGPQKGTRSCLIHVPAVLIALHARLAVAIDLASSAHTQSDHLAVIMTFRH